MLAWLTRLLRARTLPASRAGSRDPLGPAGEDVAVRHLKHAGYSILGRNLLTPAGEADILAEHRAGGVIVLVEVKSRRVAPGESAPIVAPEKSVHAAKRRKLLAILRYLSKANAWQGRDLRIDVIAVEWCEGAQPRVRHHEGIFRGRG